MSGLPLLHPAWARPRESARRASSLVLPPLPCRALPAMQPCIITGSPTTPGLGRVFRVCLSICLAACLPGRTPVPAHPCLPDRAQLLVCSSAVLATRYAFRNENPNSCGTRGQVLINACLCIDYFPCGFILLPYCRGNKKHYLAGEYPGSEPTGEDASSRYARS